MRKYFISFLIAIFLVSCDDPKPNDLLPQRSVDVTIDVNLPAYQGLLVPGGYAFTPTSAEYGFKGILVYNRNNSYVSFDRACPHYAVNDCGAMTFDGMYLKCPCDNSLFNVINGGSSTTVNFQAREYHVEVVNSHILRISSY